MNGENRSVRQFGVMATSARNVGLWILGLGGYVGLLLLIAVLLCKCVALGKMNVAEAVGFATFGTAIVHWLVIVAAA